MNPQFNRKSVVEFLKSSGVSLESISIMKDSELYNVYLNRKNKKFFEFPQHLEKYKHLITGVANYPSVEYFLNLPIENNEPQIITLIRTSVESQISLLERLYEAEQSEYPSGKRIWLETFYEIVAWITHQRTVDNFRGDISDVQYKEGSTGFYDLAIEWTNKFEVLNKGREWDGEFFDEVKQFCKMKNNE